LGYHFILFEDRYRFSPPADFHDGTFLHLIEQLAEMSLGLECTHLNGFHDFILPQINQFVNQFLYSWSD
jgi:hypothetical protein